MNNQRKQQLFNRWYDMTYDEHIRYCSEDGCIGFIKEQPDYDESDDYDNLVSQMNNPTDYIFLKAAENSKQTKLRR